MMDNLHVLLKKYWFTDKEVSTYLCTLKLGSAPASTIARHVWEKRSTIYSLLKEFIKKWLASSNIRNNVTYFTVVSPKKLFQDVESLYVDFQWLLPEFLAIQDKASTDTKVQYFEWIHWIKNMYMMTLDHPWNDLYAFLDPYIATAEIRTFLNNEYFPERVKKKLHAHVILTQSSPDMYNPHSDETGLTSIKISPTWLNPFANEINIFGEDKVCIFNYSKQEVWWLIIQSKSFYQTMKHIFDFIWDLSQDVK